MRRAKMGMATLTLMIAMGGWAGLAHAQLTSAHKCEKLKNLAAGKRALCTATERGKEIAGKPFDYAGCTTKMADQFDAAEQSASKHGGACPTTGDAADVEARIDGIFNPSQALPKALSGVRFVDNGDGTVTDTETGLQWEKKDNLDGTQNYGDPHDADNSYTWTVNSPPYEAPGGTVFTDFLYKLNNCISNNVSVQVGGFAGHCDWRLPTLLELESIVDGSAPGCCAHVPCPSYSACIDPVFGPTSACFDTCIDNEQYWSTTTDQFYAFTAVCVDFVYATIATASQTKANPNRARAVRTAY